MTRSTSSGRATLLAPMSLVTRPRWTGMMKSRKNSLKPIRRRGIKVQDAGIRLVTDRVQQGLPGDRLVDRPAGRADELDESHEHDVGGLSRQVLESPNPKGPINPGALGVAHKP